MESPNLLPHVDELVMEYLLFRGFTKHAGLLRCHSFQVDTVLETWKFLTARFFNHLDASYAPTALLRLYVVNAVKTGRREKAAEFFQLHADKLNASVAATGGAGADSWSRWFILPYIEHPETDAYFQVFFGQPWLEAFVMSFRNFLSLVFRNLPLPKLLAFQLTRLEEPTLKLRLKVSQSEATRLRLYNAEAATKIKKLEEAGRQLHSILRMMVQHSFMEHFSASSLSHGDGKSDSRSKNRSRSRSYGPTIANAGLSHQQMKELGELFGICSPEEAAPIDPEPIDQRDIPRVAEVYLPTDDLSDEEALDQDDEEDEVEDEDEEVEVAVRERRDSSGPMSPMFSPIIAAPEPFRGEDSSNESLSAPSSTLSAHNSWPTNATEKTEGSSQVSLIREFNMLNDWEPTTSLMTTRSRFSPDGQFLAIAKLGNTQVDIWSANPVVLSPSSAIKLPAKLTNLDWLGALGPMMSDSSSDMHARQLICAREAPIAACLLTSVDEADGAKQQVLVLHGGTEEPMEDYLRMDGKHLTCLAWSNAGDLLITGSGSGQVDIIDVIRPERIHRCNLLTAAGPYSSNIGSLAAICLSPDGESMLSVQTSGLAVVEWSIAPILSAAASPFDATNDVRGSVIDVSPTVAFTYDLGEPLAGRDGDVDIVIRFLSASDYFAVADSTALRLYKRGEKVAVSTLIPNQTSISDVDWHPTLPMCCTANQDGTISLWDTKATAISDLDRSPFSAKAETEAEERLEREV
ncbi:hypothetical protein BBJ28_00008055 [Nothophytophthora sp. Chile5]|nr:hypothetical protein BBJ28_00008055 [Nothophytophthora sp. Chile5]